MLKLWTTKKLKLTARKGSAALMSVLIAAALSGIIGYSSVKLTSANLNAVKATNISTQAEQYAKARAGLIRATKYDDLAASGKTSLADGNYKIEVLKGSESVYDATNKINQRTMTVNVYNGSDSSPIYSLAVPRFSKEASGAGESYVTESWHSGSEGYRVWSDGFIEQWGSVYCGTYGNYWEAADVERIWYEGKQILGKSIASLSCVNITTRPSVDCDFSVTGNIFTAKREITRYESSYTRINPFTCYYYVCGY